MPSIWFQQVSNSPRLCSDLKKYAPDDQTNCKLSLDPGVSLGDIHKMLSIQKGDHVSLINGQRAAPYELFKDGDTLVRLPPISGG
jgi:hypothetical protein